MADYVLNLDLSFPGLASLDFDDPDNSPYIISQRQWRGLLELLNLLVGPDVQYLAEHECSVLKDIYEPAQWWVSRAMPLPSQIVYLMVQRTIPPICEDISKQLVKAVLEEMAEIGKTGAHAGTPAYKEALEIAKLLGEYADQLSPLADMLKSFGRYKAATVALTDALEMSKPGQADAILTCLSRHYMRDVFSALEMNRAPVADLANFGLLSESFFVGLGNNIADLNTYLADMKSAADKPKVLITKAAQDGLVAANKQWGLAMGPLMGFNQFWTGLRDADTYPNLSHHM